MQVQRAVGLGCLESHVLETNQKHSSPKQEQIEKDINLLVFYMQGKTFCIGDPYYQKIKRLVDLTPFIVERDDFNCPLNYPVEKLGNNIALRWLGDIGPGRTAIFTPDQFTNLLTELIKVNSDIGRDLYNNLLWKAFYGQGRAKSY
ncbi:MAG: hypothetical protein HY094_04805 [Candidatus Melainabacteria bacterium]|nr:hypothetical protein [Candidatus Melainabacteria bacterium]